MRSITRRLGAALATLPFAFALVACGGDDAPEEPAAPTWKAQEVAIADATLNVPATWINNVGTVGTVETLFTNTPAGEEPSVHLIADARESYKETLEEYATESMTWDEELKTLNDTVTVNGVDFFHVSQKANDETGMPAQEFFGAIHDGNVYKFDFTVSDDSQDTLIDEIVSTIAFP